MYNNNSLPRSGPLHLLYLINAFQALISWIATNNLNYFTNEQLQSILLSTCSNYDHMQSYFGDYFQLFHKAMGIDSMGNNILQIISPNMSLQEFLLRLENVLSSSCLSIHCMLLVDVQSFLQNNTKNVMVPMSSGLQLIPSTSQTPLHSTPMSSHPLNTSSVPMNYQYMIPISYPSATTATSFAYPSSNLPSATQYPATYQTYATPAVPSMAVHPLAYSNLHAPNTLLNSQINSQAQVIAEANNSTLPPQLRRLNSNGNNNNINNINNKLNKSSSGDNQRKTNATNNTSSSSSRKSSSNSRTNSSSLSSSRTNSRSQQSSSNSPINKNNSNNNHNNNNSNILEPKKSYSGFLAAIRKKGCDMLENKEYAHDLILMFTYLIVSSEKSSYFSDIVDRIVSIQQQFHEIAKISKSKIRSVITLMKQAGILEVIESEHPPTDTCLRRLMLIEGVHNYLDIRELHDQYILHTIEQEGYGPIAANDLPDLIWSFTNLSEKQHMLSILFQKYQQAYDLFVHQELLTFPPGIPLFYPSDYQEEVDELIEEEVISYHDNNRSASTSHSSFEHFHDQEPRTIYLNPSLSSSHSNSNLQKSSSTTFLSDGTSLPSTTPQGTPFTTPIPTGRVIQSLPPIISTAYSYAPNNEGYNNLSPVNHHPSHYFVAQYPVYPIPYTHVSPTNAHNNNHNHTHNNTHNNNRMNPSNYTNIPR